jgi:hypothetical protein
MLYSDIPSRRGDDREGLEAVTAVGLGGDWVMLRLCENAKRLLNRQDWQKSWCLSLSWQPGVAIFNRVCILCVST